MKKSILPIIGLSFLFIVACENYTLDERFTSACPDENNTICLSAICSDGTKGCLNELMADGLTTLQIIAHVPAAIDDGFNEISFKTSKGNFPGELDKVNPKIKAEDGQAMVTLNVGTIAGPGKVEATVTANDISYTATFDFELGTVQTSSLQFFIDEEDPSLFDDIALADGERVVRLTTKVDGLDVFGKKVKLTISGEWAFIDHTTSSVELELKDVPEVVCLARMTQQSGECILRAEFEGRSEILVITSERAEPESIIDIVPNPQLIASANGMTTLKTYLTRSDGKVSLDTRVVFEATQEQDNGIVNLGFFDPPFGKSNADEIAEVKYLTPADSIVVDSLPIMIKSWVADQPEIRDSVLLIVQ